MGRIFYIKLIIYVAIDFLYYFMIKRKLNTVTKYLFFYLDKYLSRQINVIGSDDLIVYPLGVGYKDITRTIRPAC